MSRLCLILGILLFLQKSEGKSAELQFHRQLEKQDLKHLFQVESHDEVPEYAVVHLNSRLRKGTGTGSYTRRVHLRAFGEDQVLHLQPNQDLNRNVPVFYADHQERGTGVKLTALAHDYDIGIPYQDEASMTAVMIKHHSKTGQFSMDGTIGEDLVIRSVPMSLHGLLPPSTAPGREDEGSENALLVDDDQVFLDDEEDLEDDMIFSDSLPLEADDEFVTGESIIIDQQSANTSKNASKAKLPEGLLLLRKKRSLISTGVHLVYKRKNTPVDTDFAMMEMDQPATGSAGAKSRKKREAPYVIYPEILVLVDYDGYLMHGKDNAEIKKYYVSFWNGVDLRYKLLDSPKVKISIAGIIISRSRDAMPYLERNRVGRDAIDSASALTDMGKYLYQERRLPTYDIAVAITKYDLCRRRKSGNCTTGTAGFAYVGGACVVNKRLQKVNSVAIVEDTGGFSGIIVAAHEVGHLLGAVHDGSPPPSYLGGPGARRCRWKDGYIMSDLRHTERGFRWSACSVKQFHHFLNGETATCLYNLPHEDESLPRVLPGKRLSLDKQCRMDRGTSACFKDERVCAQLFCFDSSSGFCVSYRPAAEGSPCGNGRICLNGKCAYDNDNTIDHDLHSPDDNFLDDYSPIIESSSTPIAATSRPTSSSTSTSSSTTSRPSISTKRTTWWKYNNRWNKKSFSRTTTYSSPTTTKRPTPTTKWTTTTTTSTTTTSKPPTTTSVRTTTPRPTTSTTSAKPKSHTSLTTSSPVTSRRTTEKNKWYQSTTTKYKRPTPTYRSRNKNKAKNKLNSFKSNDSNTCEDSISNIAGSLTCQEFLKNYGFRYCNHRYIQKNCCRSKKEMCTDQ